MDLVKKVVEISNEFERLNNDLKREYIVSNIIMYNAIASMIRESRGTFGTGYPFYVLSKDFKGSLPIIDEQIRYNDELLQHIGNCSFSKWKCAECLSKKGFSMPDLKQICKPCPNMYDQLKPRKIINRLPDIDMWMICDEKDIENVSSVLERTLNDNGYFTSDVDPVRTIYELESIVSTLKNGDMPKEKLPIDTHLIDTMSMYTLISQIPDILEYSFRHDKIPYLPIHPLSLRKKWQKDDVAYNFVHDYLSSFTEFDIDPKLQDILDETRQEVARKYSLDTLYEFLLKTGPESVARRHQTSNGQMKRAFEERIDEWVR